MRLTTGISVYQDQGSVFGLLAIVSAAAARGCRGGGGSAAAGGCHCLGAVAALTQSGVRRLSAARSTRSWASLLWSAVRDSRRGGSPALVLHVASANLYDVKLSGLSVVSVWPSL